MDVWLLELIKGVGRAFTQPFLYIAVITIWILAGQRLKRERKDFGARVFSPLSEWQGTIATGLIAGLVLSVLSIALGLVVSYPLLIILSVVFLLVSLPLRLTWYSAAYTLGLTYVFVLVLPALDVHPWLKTLEDVSLLSITIIMTVLLFAEAILLLKLKPNETFPERKKGKRGLWIGQHRARRAAVVPFFVLYPTGGIIPFAEWWPVISVSGESYGLVLIPMVIGFDWISRGQPVEQATKAIGRHVFLLASAVLVLTVASYFLPVLTFVTVAVGLLGREWITIRHRVRENRSPFFIPNPKGLRILGVIPGSPAADMGLVPGELIERVNNVSVRSETEFYEALQINGAFNKLEIRDEYGENRYVQRAMYEGEHHELGVLFVEPAVHEASVGFF
ncbi:PDZ domain-containing protein [Halobacillus litoralis]|uniref:PDZ domain-containing protein n=1 Tax=Halobacillus litoralis TaxID=45668 RepID=UPI001CD4C446|nr:PDZ domain-containing protein [Halobacillus litoralis]MCA0971599.1 PDZ domain-containing protein [Halobacillus litoralis]